MRHIKLTGREASVVRCHRLYRIRAGRGDSGLHATWKLEDVTDTLNSLMSAGFVESVPYYEEVQMAEMPAMTFEVNPAYVARIEAALYRR